MAMRGSRRSFLNKFTATLIRLIQKIPWLLPSFIFLAVSFTAFYSWQAAQKCASEVEVSMQFSLFHGVKLATKIIYSRQDTIKTCIK
jgi:hypothetical protein